MAAENPEPVSTIVVGVDGSDNSRVAVEWAARLAAGLGARVVAVHALGLLERLEPGAAPAPAEAHRAEIEQLFAEDWCEPLLAAGVEHRGDLRYGPPVQVMLDAAEEAGADMVVVGSRGRGASNSALLLGSTSSRLANTSPRPVLIVPLPGPGGQA